MGIITGRVSGPVVVDCGVTAISFDAGKDSSIVNVISRRDDCRSRSFAVHAPRDGQKTLPLQKRSTEIQRFDPRGPCPGGKNVAAICRCNMLC